MQRAANLRATIESRTFAISLRAIQAVFTLIVLGVSAYVASWWSHYWHVHSPSQVSFLIFAAVWTLLVLLFLSISSWRIAEPRLTHKYAIVALEALTTLFWFIGFLALGVFISERVCFGPVCHAAKAAAVFGAFQWFLFTASMALAVRQILRPSDPPSRAEKTATGAEMAEGV